MYAFGPSKPPFCVKCAIAASGVRSNAAPQPVHSKQEVRQLQKAAARAAKAEARKPPNAMPAYERARLEGAAAGTGTTAAEERSAPNGVAAPADGAGGLKRLKARFRS